MPVYLILQVFFFLVPLTILWYFFWKTLLLYKRVFIFSIVPTFVFGVPWDILSVRSGLWRYDTSPTLGIWFFGKPPMGLPFEEAILFTFLCPFFITTLVIVGWRYIKTYVR